MFDEFDPRAWAIDWTVLLYDSIASIVIVAIAVLIAYVAYRIAFHFVSKVARVSESDIDEHIVDRIKRPIKWSFIAIGITVAAQIDSSLGLVWEPLARFLRPALLGWIAYNVVRGFTAAFEARLAAGEDSGNRRSRRTRIAVVSRLLIFSIVIITIGLMLFSIPSVRSIGTTMLASAGLAALAIGAAAQPALTEISSHLEFSSLQPLCPF